MKLHIRIVSSREDQRKLIEILGMNGYCATAAMEADKWHEYQYYVDVVFPSDTEDMDGEATVEGGGMTWLKFVNIVFFQWFCFRLARVVKDGDQIGWTWIRWVVPLTGWGNDYVWIGQGAKEKKHTKEDE